MMCYSPVILLDRPQMGENIGSVARVMANFGLFDLRLIKPRDGWPNASALPMSAGAFEAGVRVRVYECYERASSDLGYVLASSARLRSLPQPVYDVREGVSRLSSGSGVVFGPENSGLSNEVVSLSAGLVNFPVNREFSSVNLSHAVALFCYEWASRGVVVESGSREVALRGECLDMIEHLEGELELRGWFFPEHKGKSMRLNLRGSFSRIGWSSQEVRSFRGMIRALTGGEGG